MARPYRLEAENTFYHLTSRGDNRKKIYGNVRDHERFLEYILKAKERYGFHLYAYVLMSNHYHLLIETLRPNLSRIMHYLNGSYTTYYNTKRKKTGHLFQGRYKSIIVDKDSYFLELTKYIHLNPVKAGMAENPEDYPWSSYAGYTGKRKDRYIDQSAIKAVTDLWGKRYRDFVMSSISEEVDPFKKVYGGILLGSTRFIKDMQKEIREYVEGQGFSHRKALMSTVEAEDILERIKDKYAITVKDLKGKQRKNNRIRNILIYLLSEIAGMTNRDIGSLLEMQFSAVSKAAVAIEREMGKNRKLRNEIRKLLSNFEA